MGIARHKNLLLFVGAFCDDLNNALQRVFNLSNFVHEPEPHISRDLVISRSAGMQLPSYRRPYELAQSPFVGGMDVFVIRLDLELWNRVSSTP
jgi:hypothetical protein